MKICCFTLVFAFLWSTYSATAQSASTAENEVKATWKALQQKELNETAFHQACDLIQDTGKTNLELSYEWLAEYVPRVQKAGKWEWAHMLLMAWARAKESFGIFEESAKLHQKVLQNAPPNSQQYREGLTGIVLLYSHWNKVDSCIKYLALGEAAAKAANDSENLSFLYTFHAANRIPPNDDKSRENYYRQAIQLAQGLKDKNAEFTARYNFVVNFLEDNPAQQVAEAEALLELAKDPTFAHRPRFYERSNFWFRNPVPSVYFYMLQQNLLLADYANTNKFADLINEVVIKPNLVPAQTPIFMTQMAFSKATIGQFEQAKAYLKQTINLLQLPEKEIPFPNYFTTLGLIAEHEKQNKLALSYHEKALAKGYTAAFYFIPPEMYYAHALTINGEFDKAQKALLKFDSLAKKQPYSATGLYYYEYLTELQKARGNVTGQLQNVQTYYSIKDSLTNLNRYRAVQQVLAKVGLREKEQQVVRLNEEKNARELQIRRERIFYAAIIGMALLTIGFLGLYLRNRQIRNQQALALKQSELEQLEKQRQLDLIQGIVAAEENERRKIADQLHDDVNASLALAALNVSSVLEKGLSDAQSRPKLSKAYEVLGVVSGTVRNISHRLTPLLIERYGFRHALEDLAETVNISGKLHLDTIIVGFEDKEKYPISFLNEVFRIIQELVQNIVKHANATHATVEAIEHDNGIALMVEDNGVGMADSTTATGKGLSSIRAKVAYLNGLIEISRGPDGGTLIVIDNLYPAE
ncbi:sensor histidine kinase [Runella sp.]|uniref:sensor histidine kinase n=1 Tax=Runella sp. TaxID=1960881 RepID=UPI003D0C4A69